MSEMDTAAEAHPYYGRAHGRTDKTGFKLPSELDEELKSIGYID